MGSGAGGNKDAQIRWAAQNRYAWLLGSSSPEDYKGKYIQIHAEKFAWVEGKRFKWWNYADCLSKKKVLYGQGMERESCKEGIFFLWCTEHGTAGNFSAGCCSIDAMRCSAAGNHRWSAGNMWITLTSFRAYAAGIWRWQICSFGDMPIRDSRVISTNRNVQSISILRTEDPYSLKTLSYGLLEMLACKSELTLYIFQRFIGLQQGTMMRRKNLHECWFAF